MKQIVQVLAVSSVFLLGLAGCGSGSGSTSKLQQKTATITFSTVSSAHTDPLLGIQLSAKLPVGVSFNNITTALTAHNDTGKLLAAAYSVSTRTLTFAVGNPSVPIRFGSFAELKCDVLPGYSFDKSSFEAINTPFPDVQMVSGIAPVTEDLTTKILVKLSVSFGY